jgi:hypothetical protein
VRSRARCVGAESSIILLTGSPREKVFFRRQTTVYISPSYVFYKSEKRLCRAPPALAPGGQDSASSCASVCQTPRGVLGYDIATCKSAISVVVARFVEKAQSVEDLNISNRELNFGKQTTSFQQTGLWNP